MLNYTSTRYVDIPYSTTMTLGSRRWIRPCFWQVAARSEKVTVEDGTYRVLVRQIDDEPEAGSIVYCVFRHAVHEGMDRSWDVQVPPGGDLEAAAAEVLKMAQERWVRCRGEWMTSAQADALWEASRVYP